MVLSDKNFQDNITTFMNAFVGACLIMRLCESEAKENFKSKKLLEEKEENLKVILNLFPSGILFYDPKKGITYKNEYFKKVCEDLSIAEYEKLKRKPKINEEINDSEDLDHSVPEFCKKNSSVRLLD